jgi:hypothetical protein
MKGVLATLLVGLTGLALAQDKPHSSAAAAAKMRASVERVLAALPEKSRAQAMRPFEDGDRTDWHYTPRSRNGLSCKEMDKAGRDAVHGLLRTALSSAGYRKAVNIVELEIVLREIETFGWMRDPERYHLTVYGTPERAKRWGWRFEGHHLSLNFTLAGDKLAAGWALLESLGEAQRREAVFEARTYGDIVTANKDRAAPLDAAGIAAAKLEGKQRALLWKLIELYAGDPLRLGRLHRPRQAALLPRAGTAVPHRVRRLAERRQPYPYRVARLQRRCRARPAARALLARPRHFAPPLD